MKEFMSLEKGLLPMDILLEEEALLVRGGSRVVVNNGCDCQCGGSCNEQDNGCNCNCS